MKRWLTASLLSLCLGLVAATGYLLTFPASALAASGTADCGYGVQIACSSNYSCVCEDGVGCTRFNYRGDTGTTTYCPPMTGPEGGGGGPIITE